MIAVLLSILKYIGITLLVLLILLLVILLLLLFAPIGYRIDGEKPESGSYYVKAKFSWLWFILHGNAFYDQGGLKYQVKALIFTIKSSEPKEEKPKKEKKQTKPAAKKETPKADSVPEKKTEPSITVRPKPEAPKPEILKSEQPKAVPPGEETTETKVLKSESSKIEAPKPKPSNPGAAESKSPKPVTSQKEDKKAKEKKEKKKAPGKNPLKEIRYTFKRIYDKIRETKNKGEKLIEYINDPRTAIGLSLVLSQLGRLLKHILPRRGRIWLHFGFDDPFTTGSLIGLMSMIQPLFGKTLWFEPEFDSSVIEGNVHCRGHIQLYVVCIVLAKLYFSKDVTFLRKGPFAEDE